MKIITRKEALAAELPFYFTGKQCKRGHIATRKTKDGVCVECSKHHQKQFYIKQKNSVEGKRKLSSLGKKYRERHPEKRKQRTAKYYEEHRTEMVEQTKLWITNNPEQSAEHRLKYRQSNKSKLTALNAKRRAQQLNATPPWLTPDDLKQIELLYVEARILTEKTGELYVVDHYYPLQGETVSGLHIPSNLRVITALENSSKSNKMP